MKAFSILVTTMYESAQRASTLSALTYSIRHCCPVTSIYNRPIAVYDKTLINNAQVVVLESKGPGDGIQNLVDIYVDVNLGDVDIARLEEEFALGITKVSTYQFIGFTQHTYKTTGNLQLINILDV